MHRCDAFVTVASYARTKHMVFPVGFDCVKNTFPQGIRGFESVQWIDLFNAHAKNILIVVFQGCARAFK
jgi:hypothetical protein